MTRIKTRMRAKGSDRERAFKIYTSFLGNEALEKCRWEGRVEKLFPDGI